MDGGERDDTAVERLCGAGGGGVLITTTTPTAFITIAIFGHCGEGGKWVQIQHLSGGLLGGCPGLTALCGGGGSSGEGTGVEVLFDQIRDGGELIWSCHWWEATEGGAGSILWE